jgi:hypothetical protein
MKYSATPTSASHHDSRINPEIFGGKGWPLARLLVEIFFDDAIYDGTKRLADYSRRTQNQDFIFGLAGNSVLLYAKPRA